MPATVQLLAVTSSTVTARIFKVLYCKIKMFFFLYVIFICYLCAKCFKPVITVQHYIADCVIWVPRLTLLDLRTNWTYTHTLRMMLIHM